ncbi:cytochrome P450 [Nocardia miyunensis]|uniref:cytochrome P450 n=1 Tax=Nocardia miyunensis TaxID=282684 RepID=UPI00082CD14E|nr:cytochrome P450 [Nocardia miyunensis]
MRLYGPEFFADPHRTYRQAHHDERLVVPVEMRPGVQATAVIGFEHAREILDDPVHYPTDLSAGQAHPRVEFQDRPDLSQATGADHTRLRRAVRECLEKIDQHAIRTTTRRVTAELIAAFCREGSADLVGDFAIPLVVHIFSRMLGLAPEAWAEADSAVRTLRATADARALHEVAWAAVEAARTTPGPDVTSWLCGHPEGLDDHEVVQQLMLLHTTGCLPTVDLIANTLLRVMTDKQFREAVMFAALTYRDALEHVLALDPPRPVLRPRWPPSLQIRDGVHMHPHQPVLISLAGCAADPIMGADRTENYGSRSHLAWGGGPHKCPATAAATAMLLGEEALGLLFESLPDMNLAPGERIEFLPSLYHRALVALPVVFDPSSPLPLS